MENRETEGGRKRFVPSPFVPVLFHHLARRGYVMDKWYEWMDGWILRTERMERSGYGRRKRERG
jgi:hypothetical protein